MTLSTEVYILDKVDPEEVFKFCQGMLTQYDESHRTPEQQKWVTYPGATWSRDNELGQGLPAWLTTTYIPDSPLRPDGDACDDYCDSPDSVSSEPYHHHRPALYMSVDFDTAYGYRDSRGWNCGDLHAAMVLQLGAWLDAKGVRWMWKNEYSGEIFLGKEGIQELGLSSVNAITWFRNDVLPVIERYAKTS